MSSVLRPIVHPPGIRPDEEDQAEELEYGDQNYDHDEDYEEDEEYAEKHLIYTWVDSLSLSRPKRNISRDFSDGVLVAEIVASYLPKNFVEMHNYSAANSVTQKIYNYNTLNRKVFRRLGFEISPQEIEEITRAQPGAIESLLGILKEYLEKYVEKVKAEREMCKLEPPQVKPTPNYLSQPKHQLKSPTRIKANRQTPGKGGNSASISPKSHSHTETITALREEMKDKDLVIGDLRATINILNDKVLKLEHLVTIKDAKVEALQGQLRGTGRFGRK